MIKSGLHRILKRARAGVRVPVPNDPIRQSRRILLFARVPFALGAALWLADARGYFAARDAMLLGLDSGAHRAAPLALSALILLLASLLPGLAVLTRGAGRGLFLGILGLFAYYLGAWAGGHQFGVVLPIIAPTAAWYFSQILGLGWQPHATQDVRHILPVEQRGVFLSYRRQQDETTARLIKQELSARGFDVFLDVDDLGPSPRFDERLLEEVGSRHGFVLLLSPGSLDRCVDEQDWLRREIAHALDTNRRVVPVLRGGIDLSACPLPAALAPLPLHNAVIYSSTHHAAVMQLLIGFLCTPRSGRRAG